MSTPYIRTPVDLQAIRNYQISRSGVLNGPNPVLNEESLEAVLGAGTATVRRLATLWSMHGLPANPVQSRLSSVGLCP